MIPPGLMISSFPAKLDPANSPNIYLRRWFTRRVVSIDAAIYRVIPVKLVLSLVEGTGIQAFGHRKSTPYGAGVSL